MSWSYSGDPSTSDKDAVRYLIGDTDEDNPLVNDEEIEYILSIEGNVIRAGAMVAESIAGKFSRRADRTIGDYSEKFSQIHQQYLSLAEKLRRQAKFKSSFKAIPFAGGISKSDKKTTEGDTDREKPAFKKGMMDNDRLY